MDDATCDQLLDTLRHHEWRDDPPPPHLLQLTQQISPRTPALIVFSRKLTLTPYDMTSQDHDDVRRNGSVSDVELLDLVQVVGYFNYANRIIAGLAVRLESGEGAAGQ